MYQLTDCPICSTSSISFYIRTKAQMHSENEFFNFDICSDCNLVFLNPRVALDELKNYYTSHYLPYRGAKAWGKYEQLVENSQKKMDLKRVNRIKEFHSISSETLVLDVGCGRPTFLQSCREVLNCKTLGIDFSDEGWKEESVQFEGLNLQVSEIKDLSSQLKPDVITMWHYLEHDYAPTENLRYLHSISKQSTTLLIEIPNFDSESRKKFGENWAGWHTPRHISLFSPKNIEKLLDQCGWKVSKIMTYGTMDPYLLYWMSEMEQREIDWDKNMESEFWSFTRGMVKFLPKKWKEKRKSLGIMTVIATPV